MKRYRKATALALATAMILSTAACGKKTLGTSSTDAGAAIQETDSTGARSTSDLKAGVCIYKFNDDFTTLYCEELKNYLMNQYGIAKGNITIMGSKGDQEERNTQIDNFFSYDVDVLILNLVQASATESVVNQCREADASVVFINREPEESELKRWADETIAAAYVGADAKQPETFQGEVALETPNKGDFNGDGVVSYAMIMGDPRTVDTQYRTGFFIKALEDNGTKTEKLFGQHGDWDQTRGRELAASALAQYNDKLEVIFYNNDAMAGGAQAAIRAAGRTVGGGIHLVDMDALEETIDYIKEGTVAGTVLNDRVSQSHTAADVAVKMVADEKVDTRYTVNYIKLAMDVKVAAAGNGEATVTASDLAAGAGEFQADICINQFDDDFMSLYYEELQNYLETACGARITAVDAGSDQAEQESQIDQFISQGVDVLILNLVQTSVAEDVVNKCKEADIPVVFISREPNAAEIEKQSIEFIATSYVGPDAGQPEAFQGESVPETPEEEGSMVNDYVGPSHMTTDVAAQMAAGNKVETKYVADQAATKWQIQIWENQKSSVHDDRICTPDF